LAERIRKDGSFGSKRAMCSAEKPSDAERDSYGRIGLIFDGVAQCLLKGTAVFRAALVAASATWEAASDISSATPPACFLASRKARLKSVLEVSGMSRAPLELGLSGVNAQT